MKVVWKERAVVVVVPISVEKLLSVPTVMLPLTEETSGMPTLKPTVREVVKVVEVDHVRELDTSWVRVTVTSKLVVRLVLLSMEPDPTSTGVTSLTSARFSRYLMLKKLRLSTASLTRRRALGSLIVVPIAHIISDQ